MERTGFFISVEGTVGAGKTTVIHALERGLKAAGVTNIVRTRDGDDTAPGASLRRFLSGHGDAIDPFSFLLVQTAARFEQVQKLIVPGLVTGAVIIADTFYDTAFAQHTAAQSLAGPLIESLNERAIQNGAPDITLLLDGDSDEFLRKRKAGASIWVGKDVNVPKVFEFQRKMRDVFLSQADAEPARFRILDGSASIDDVRAEAWGAVRAAMERKGWKFSEEVQP